MSIIMKRKNKLKPLNKQKIIKRLPHRLPEPRILVLIGVTFALALVAYLSWPSVYEEATQPPVKDQEIVGPQEQESAPEPKKKTTKKTPPANEIYTIEDPSNTQVVVNKGRKLPSSYTPASLIVPDVALRYSSGSEMQLRSVAADALVEMFKSAKADGQQLMVASGYRSYSLQSSVFNRYVSELGKTEAEKISARPGHSEHQTGLSLDIAPTSSQCLLEECFGTLAEGKWLANNAYKFGFILRYPKGKESLTGYSYEPWHFRFVGTDVSESIYSSGQTLEQYFGLPTFSTYPA